jgi:hypothetical protein
MKSACMFGASLLCCVLIVIGCDKSNSAGSGDRAEVKAEIPAAVFQMPKPIDAKEVVDIKHSANVGDSVVVRGRIAGSKDPFVSGRAMFTLADAKLPLCSEMAEDKCPTPWDLCCEPKDRLAEHTLTIEIDDASGKALTGTLRNVGGLAPGKTVFVKGHVTQKPSAQAMIIRAEGISVGS